MAPVTAFETGTNIWRKLHAWPPSGKDGPRKLYLQPNGGLAFTVPPESDTNYTAYVADPAHPVPYRDRPIATVDPLQTDQWQTWLVADQRNAESRPDVLTYRSAVLPAPLRLSGKPIANIVATTTGSDGDFVVKLIDVYPDEVGRDAKMGGYQLMVSADILRGRYRQSFENPAPIPSGEKQVFKFSLPNLNHVFLPGHRVMVQIQSSWFPLYDRNPQTYVDNIMFAKPGDYRPATISVYDGGKDASFVELPAVPMPPP